LFVELVPDTYEGITGIESDPVLEAEVMSEVLPDPMKRGDVDMKSRETDGLFMTSLHDIIKPPILDFSLGTRGIPTTFCRGGESRYFDNDGIIAATLCTIESRPMWQQSRHYCTRFLERRYFWHQC
jgi:hypothetical protein